MTLLPVRPVVGVLGGMGPLATADFCSKLARRTPAETESDHLRTIVVSDPTIPDRTRALQGVGPSPVQQMVVVTHILMDAGASVVVVPCNTAHAFLAEVAEATGAVFIDMVEATIRDCRHRLGTGSVVGLLSTEGTRLSGLYRHAAARAGLRVVESTQQEQAGLVDAAIAEIKTSGDLDRAGALVRRAAEALVDRGATVVVAACTELPLVIEDDVRGVPTIDPTDCLARETVRRCWWRPGADPHRGPETTIMRGTPHG